jgi:hypothetical protein
MAVKHKKYIRWIAYVTIPLTAILGFQIPAYADSYAVTYTPSTVLQSTTTNITIGLHNAWSHDIGSINVQTVDDSGTHFSSCIVISAYLLIGNDGTVTWNYTAPSTPQTITVALDLHSNTSCGGFEQLTADESYVIGAGDPATVTYTPTTFVASTTTPVTVNITNNYWTHGINSFNAVVTDSTGEHWSDCVITSAPIATGSSGSGTWTYVSPATSQTVSVYFVLNSNSSCSGSTLISATSTYPITDPAPPPPTDTGITVRDVNILSVVITAFIAYLLLKPFVWRGND